MKVENRGFKKPRNTQYLRDSNRAEILRYLATKGTASRIGLSNQLRLTKMAISTIVAELLEENLLEECGPINGSLNQTASGYSGRKAIALAIPNYRINAIGIFILRYQIKGIAIDIKGNIIYSTKIDLPIDTNNENFIELNITLIQEILNATSSTKFTGIGIASIGPLDIYKQKILNPPNFRDIHEVCIGDIIREHFGLPVFLDNDMNAGALAEHLYGIAKNMRDIVYLGLGSGVGAGIIVNGRMLHGSGGYAGEIGHMSIQSDGLKCSCGRNGCLELYTNTISLLQNAGVSTIKELLEEESREPRNERVQQCIKDYFESILNALVTIVNLFDPEIVIIGDQGAYIVPLFIEKLEGDMNKLMFQYENQKIHIAASSFGEAAPLVGAAALVFQKVFNSEVPLNL
ncbi:MAG TPA: ROK family protein [Ruminiclostridium sp.]